jgi:hypothetical protein
MEPGLEAGTDRETESRLEGFVGRDYLGGGKSLGSRFRGNDGTAGSDLGQGSIYGLPGNGGCGSRNDRWISQETAMSWVGTNGQRQT